MGFHRPQPQLVAMDLRHQPYVFKNGHENRHQNARRFCAILLSEATVSLAT
jgi:hypothetical protein